jgi:hypothetical protein
MTTVLLSAGARADAAAVRSALEPLGDDDVVLVALGAPAGLDARVRVVLVRDPDAASRAPVHRAVRAAGRVRGVGRYVRRARGGPARRFWRAVRAQPQAVDALRRAAVVVALDSPAVFAAWHAARRSSAVAVNGSTGLARLREAQRLVEGA